MLPSLLYVNWLCEQEIFRLHPDFFLVPITASDALRRLIEALFITHTEAQLNTDGHLDRLLFPDTTINHIDLSEQQNLWCKNLLRRPSN